MQKYLKTKAHRWKVRVLPKSSMPLTFQPLTAQKPRAEWGTCPPLEQYELLSNIASLLHPRSLFILFFYPLCIYQMFSRSS